MSVRTAIRQNALVTFALFFTGIWMGLTALHVANRIANPLAANVEVFGQGHAIGQTFVAGLIGLLVLSILLGFMLTLYGEVSEVEPLPDTFPPRR